jgi:hypothetical protein
MIIDFFVFVILNFTIFYIFYKFFQKLLKFLLLSVCFFLQLPLESGRFLTPVAVGSLTEYWHLQCIPQVFAFGDASKRSAKEAQFFSGSCFQTFGKRVLGGETHNKGMGGRNETDRVHSYQQEQQDG